MLWGSTRISLKTALEEIEDLQKKGHKLTLFFNPFNPRVAKLIIESGDITIDNIWLERLPSKTEGKLMFAVKNTKTGRFW